MSKDPPRSTAAFVAAEGSEGDPPAAPAGARAVSLVTESRDDPDADLTALLRRRLRHLVLVFLAVYAAFLVRDVLAVRRDGVHFQMTTFLVVTPLQAVLAAAVWSPWASTARRIRALELLVLGLCWLVLGTLQFVWLCSWSELEVYVVGERGPDGQILIANSLLMPWLVLIAGYPVVVPNPVRRTLTIAGAMAVLPFAVTVVALVVDKRLTWGHTWMMFVQFAIWFPLAVGLAVYGAHQGGLLRAQAHAARRFGQYRLTRKLGGGGMGEVYLAEHLLLRRPSVVKVIRPDRARDPALLRRFEREVQILATLTHWNTVEVFDYGHTADGTFYYVMEYLPGPDCDDLVTRHGPLPPGRVVHLLRQVCAALNEAHAVGLIHRDIKPSNLIVCRRGGVSDVVKLLDFGLVQVGPAGADPETATRLTGEGAVLGTPAFMSPEQAAGRPGDGRIDVYSLGATAYFLLTGRSPFQGTAMEVIAAHITAPPPEFGPDVPPDLAAVVRRCLGKRPGDRYETVAHLDAALADCGCAAEWDANRAAEWWDRCAPV